MSQGKSQIANRRSQIADREETEPRPAGSGATTDRKSQIASRRSSLAAYRPSASFSERGEDVTPAPGFANRIGFAICDLRFAIFSALAKGSRSDALLSAICDLRFAICDLLRARQRLALGCVTLCDLRSAICDFRFAIWLLIPLLGLTGCGFFERAEDGSLQINPNPRYCIDEIAKGVGSGLSRAIVLSAGATQSFTLTLTVNVLENCDALPSPQWEISAQPNPKVATASLSGNVLTIVGVSDPSVAVRPTYGYLNSSSAYTSIGVSLANAPQGARNVTMSADIEVRQTDFIERSDHDPDEEWGFRVAPSALAFGNTLVNAEAVQSLFISNISEGGGGDEVVVALSGPNAGDFNLGGFSGTLSNLAEGKVFRTPVIFKPRSAGFKGAQLTVTTPFGVDGAAVVNLSGTGVNP